MDQLFCLNIDLLGRSLRIVDTKIADESKVAILAIDVIHQDTLVLLVLKRDEDGRWDKEILGDFPDPGQGVGHLLACDTDWMALLARKANVERLHRRVLLWGPELDRKEIHLSGSPGARVTLALTLKHPFIILCLLENGVKLLINVYKLGSGVSSSEGALLVKSIPIPDLDLHPTCGESLQMRFISNCQLLGFVFQDRNAKIVQLFEKKDLMREDTSDQPTWTRRICLPAEAPWDDTGHLTIDMNTTSLVYAALWHFDNYAKEEVEVDLCKKDFWMGSSDDREYE